MIVPSAPRKRTDGLASGAERELVEAVSDRAQPPLRYPGEPRTRV
jgi:hypothetical protein